MIEELEVEAAAERAEVKAVVVEVEEAELVKGRGGVNGASELPLEIPEIPLFKCLIKSLIEITRWRHRGVPQLESISKYRD